MTTRAITYSKTANYKTAHTPEHAEKMVDGFLSRARADGGITYKERFLGTPALFSYLLTLVDAKRQRSVKPATIENYFNDCKAGRWRAGVGSDLLLLDRSGKTYLFDGQHRCSAFAQANMAIEVWLSHAKDPQAFVGVDQNKNRSTADVRKMRSGEALTAAALSSAIYEKLHFPHRYRGSVAQRDAELEDYDLLDKLRLLPRGKTGELASLLRAMRFDPTDTPLALAWFTSFIQGETDICGVHEPTLKSALRLWDSRNKMTNGDIRTKTISWITGNFYLKFYEQNDTVRSLPRDFMDAPHPVDLAYVQKENSSDNARCKVPQALQKKIRQAFKKETP